MKFISFQKTFFALCIILLSAGCNSGSNGPVTLKFQPREGKPYEYHMEMNMDMEMQGQSVSNSMIYDYKMEVTDVKDGVRTLKATYDRIQMKVKAPAANLDIDTDKAQPAKDTTNREINPMDLIGTMMYAMKGKSFTMLVNEKGDIVEVKGIRELGNEMLQSMEIDETERPVAENAFRSQFNEENMKQIFSQSFNMFPDKPIKVGDTWNKDLKIGEPMAMNINTTYKVQRIKNNEVILDSDSKITVSGMNGTQKGTFTIDAETGIVREGSYDQEINGQMKIKAKGKISSKGGK